MFYVRLTPWEWSRTYCVCLQATLCTPWLRCSLALRPSGTGGAQWVVKPEDWLEWTCLWPKIPELGKRPLKWPTATRRAWLECSFTTSRSNCHANPSSNFFSSTPYVAFGRCEYSLKAHYTIFCCILLLIKLTQELIHAILLSAQKWHTSSWMLCG